MEGSGFLTFQNRLSSTWSNKTNKASHDQQVDLALRLGLPTENQEAPFHGVIPQNFNNNSNMPTFHQQGMGNGGILLQNAGGHERNIDFSRRLKHRPWPLPVLNMVSNNWSIMSGNSGKQQRQQQKKICKMCDRTETPLWRKGPDGPKTLCNGCGLRYARVIKRR